MFRPNCTATTLPRSGHRRHAAKSTRRLPTIPRTTTSTQRVSSRTGGPTHEAERHTARMPVQHDAGSPSLTTMDTSHGIHWYRPAHPCGRPTCHSSRTKPPRTHHTRHKLHSQIVRHNGCKSRNTQKHSVCQQQKHKHHTQVTQIGLLQNQHQGR